MEDKVKFIPLIVDYPARITNRVLTDDEKKMVDELGNKMRDMMEKHNVHMNINNYIYMPTGIYLHKRGYKRPTFSKKWKKNIDY
jgi:hypothetical protein